MPPCNVVFGRTGCGKTSLRNMLLGNDPEPDSLTSGTTDATVYDLGIDGKIYLYVDTAGILDNRADGEDLQCSRAEKVNNIGALLKEKELDTCRVLYCVASTERILKEELDWLADILQMLGGKQVLNCFAIVLTKVDDGFQKRKFDKGFEDNELVKVLQQAFPNCPIATSGYDNVETVKKLLVPSCTMPAFAVAAADIKMITPKADLETQLKNTQAQLASMIAIINGKGASKEATQNQMEGFENEIDGLQERITNAGWWCPGSEIAKANNRIRQCRSLIRDLKCNAAKTDEDKQRFERQKLELVDAITEAEVELREKSSLGKMFMKLLLH